MKTCHMSFLLPGGLLAFTLSASLLGLVPTTLSAAETGAASDAAENIALGKSYTLCPQPSYSHCTDPGDREQLTDGKTTTGYFWTQLGTIELERRSATQRSRSTWAKCNRSPASR